jgi:hypothetical protein
MTSAQKNSSALEFIGDRVDDSRNDADRSKINSPKSAKRQFSRSNKVPLQYPSLSSPLSSETLEALIALATELKRVRRRLISEGYVIDGKHIYKPRENAIQN